MIRRINITLAILCTAGALFIAGALAYEHFYDAESGRVAQTVQEGDYNVEER